MSANPFLAITQLRQIFGSRLLQNIGALTLVQGVGYLVPLITLPWLTRVLGPQEWGQVMWVRLLLGCLTTFTDWGFSFSGTRKIAAHRDDPSFVSRVFFAAWTAQWLLCALAIALLVMLAFFAPQFSSVRTHLLVGTSVTIAGVLFPVWLLAALELLREVALVQLVIRLSTLPLIFLLVRGPEDGPWVIAITGFTGLLGGLFSLIWMRKTLSLSWAWPSPRQVVHEVVEGASLFVSRATIELYTNLVPVMLGLMVDAVTVGQYAIADRIRVFAHSTLDPASRALFPRMSHLRRQDPARARVLMWRSGSVIFSVGVLISLALWVLAEPLCRLAGALPDGQAVHLLRWLALLPALSAASNVLGTQIMLPNEMGRPLSVIMTVTGLSSLALAGPAIHWGGAEGAAINFVLMEAVVAAGIAIYVWRRRAHIYTLKNE